MSAASRYPATPGTKGRSTSADAADEIREASPLLRRKAFEVLERSNGLTADEVAEHLGLSILSVRPRLTELNKLGKVKDSGERRRNVSGRNAIVWAPINPTEAEGAE